MNLPSQHRVETGDVVAVHRAGGEWRVLTARVERGRTSVVEAASFPAAESAAAAAHVAKAGHGARVLQVVPAAGSVARTCPLPDADLGALEAALQLQAESHLAAAIPGHRRGAGVLERNENEPARRGLVVGWPESFRAESLPLEHGEIRFVPEVAALAGLVGAERPGDAVVSVDREHGSVGLGLGHLDGMAWRSTSEPLDDDDWHASLRRVVVETALAADHTAGYAKALAETAAGGTTSLAPSGATVLVPKELEGALARRVEQLPGERGWLARYGVALGAVLAVSSDLAGAAGLQSEARLERPTRTAAIRAALAVAGHAPMASAGLRLAVLRGQSGDLDALQSQVRDARVRLAMARELQGSAWSMTKVLADLSCCTPDKVTLDSVRVVAASRTVTVTGITVGGNEMEAKGRVATMQRLLQESGIFESPTVNWGLANQMGQYDFSLSAKIADPHRRFRYPMELDYGRWTAWDRLAGNPMPEGDAPLANAGEGVEAPPDEGAVAVADAGADAGEAPTTSRPTTSRPPTTSPGSRRPSGARPSPVGGTGTAGGGSAADIETRSEGGNLSDIPEPVDPAVIANITDRNELLAILQPLSEARNRLRGVEGMEEVAERVNKDWQMVFDRLREVPR